MKLILIFETACLAFFSSLTLFYSGARSSDDFFVPSMCLMFLVLHGLIVPFKGLDFVPADAQEEDHAIAVYWWVCIFVGVFGGQKLADFAFAYLVLR